MVCKTAPGPRTVKVDGVEITLTGNAELDRKRLLAHLILRHRDKSSMNVALLLDEKVVAPALEAERASWRELVEEMMGDYLGDGFLSDKTEKRVYEALKGGKS